VHAGRQLANVAAIWTEPFAAGVIVAVPTSTPCAFLSVAVAFCVA
jgi:hypothetical protein